MCDACFNKEIPRFVTHEEFEKFDLELSKKIKPLSESGLKYLGDSEFALDIGYGKYLCQNCKTEWWYSEPDNAWRGFFVRKENGKHVVVKYQQDSKKKPYGCIVVLVIITVIVWFLIT
jgi:hypothetical protein